MMKKSRWYRFKLWVTREKNPFTDGPSLPSQMRRMCATELDGTDCRTGLPLKKQVPQYRYPAADSARLRAKEYVRRYLQLRKKVS